MENEPEIMRHQIFQTRASLGGKVEMLEDQVVNKVQGATNAVVNAAETINKSVQDAVQSVKGAVEQTTDTLKNTLDLRRQVEKHPWAVVSGSIALGYVGGCLLSRAEPRHAGNDFGEPHALPQSLLDVSPRLETASDQTYMETSRQEVPKQRQSEWISDLAAHFAPEITKLKGLAVGTLLGTIRDMVTGSLPGEMRSQVRDLLDNVTVKLGGEPIRDPLTGGSD